MIDYAKIILPKVSFSKELFKKELIKCIKWVEPEQLKELHDWCYQNFKNQYAAVLDEVFSYEAA